MLWLLGINTILRRNNITTQRTGKLKILSNKICASFLNGLLKNFMIMGTTKLYPLTVTQQEY